MLFWIIFSCLLAVLEAWWLLPASSASVLVLPGAVFANAYLEVMQAAVPYVLALAAASFMLAGIGTIAIFHLNGLG